MFFMGFFAKLNKETDNFPRSPFIWQSSIAAAVINLPRRMREF